ncbi:Fic/DOC family protein [Oribacterium parvum ACB8]|nr:Fic/DOC family protein [Oribacterium parvum ACB8]
MAIEQNTLSLDQVSDVINGKRVLGPPEDIREVKNAYEAYEHVSELDPYSIKNLLYAHKLMTEGLVKEAGRFRSGNVGVYAGECLIHAGTPARYVPDLISQLMAWLKESKYHPLVKSCIFHYEFEFIHPFMDGNGRTGRLWQSLILRKWNDLFAWLPVETLVHENQEEYYRVLQKADNAGDSTEFVEFMLGMIRNALKELRDNQNHDTNEANAEANREANEAESGAIEDQILRLIRANPKISQTRIAEEIGVSRSTIQRAFAKLMEGGLVRRSGGTRGSWIIQEKHGYGRA